MKVDNVLGEIDDVYDELMSAERPSSRTARGSPRNRFFEFSNNTDTVDDGVFVLNPVNSTTSRYNSNRRTNNENDLTSSSTNTTKSTKTFSMNTIVNKMYHGSCSSSNKKGTPSSLLLTTTKSSLAAKTVIIVEQHQENVENSINNNSIKNHEINKTCFSYDEQISLQIYQEQQPKHASAKAKISFRSLNNQNISSSPSSLPTNQSFPRHTPVQHHKFQELNEPWQHLQVQQDFIHINKQNNLFISNISTAVPVRAGNDYESTEVSPLLLQHQLHNCDMGDNSRSVYKVPKSQSQRATSFLSSGCGEPAFRSSEQDATAWQLEIPSLTEFKACTDMCNFLDHIHRIKYCQSQQTLSSPSIVDTLHCLVGKCRLQLTSLISTEYSSNSIANHTTNNNIYSHHINHQRVNESYNVQTQTNTNTEKNSTKLKCGDTPNPLTKNPLWACHKECCKPIVQLLLKNIPNDFEKIVGYVQSGSNEVLIVERQRTFLCIVRATNTNMEHCGKIDSINSDQRNTKVNGSTCPPLKINASKEGKQQKLSTTIQLTQDCMIHHEAQQTSHLNSNAVRRNVGKSKYTTKDNKNMIKSTPVGTVTVYLEPYLAFTNLQIDLFPLLDTLAEQNPFYDVIFTGHGYHGASVATISAYVYATTRSSIRVAAITTGSTSKGFGFEDFRLSVHSTPNLKVLRMQLGCIVPPISSSYSTLTEQYSTKKAKEVGHLILIDPSIIVERHVQESTLTTIVRNNPSGHIDHSKLCPKQQIESNKASFTMDTRQEEDQQHHEFHQSTKSINNSNPFVKAYKFGIIPPNDRTVNNGNDKRLLMPLTSVMKRNPISAVSAAATIAANSKKMLKYFLSHYVDAINVLVSLTAVRKSEKKETMWITNYENESGIGIQGHDDEIRQLV